MVKPRSSGQARRKNQPSANSRTFLGGILVIVIIGVATLAYLAGRPNQPAVSKVDPNLPPAVAKGYTLGPANAPVHILEFADFECPACGDYAVVTEPDVRKRIIDAGLASVTYYDFPLPQHKNTLVASEAAACANDQGKFWEMHDRLFQGQTDWNTEATRNPASVMKGYAQELGLDVNRWQQCVDSRAHERDIMANKSEGERRNIGQTPTFVIGARMIPGEINADQMKVFVDSAAAAAGPSAAPVAAAGSATTSPAAPARASATPAGPGKHAATAQ
jgi:protein-disulfide isomerase